MWFLHPFFSLVKKLVFLEGSPKKGRLLMARSLRRGGGVKDRAIKEKRTF